MALRYRHNQTLASLVDFLEFKKYFLFIYKKKWNCARSKDDGNYEKLKQIPYQNNISSRQG